MEEEKIRLPTEEKHEGEDETATLLEQSVMLIDQAFNSVTYHRHLNILSTFIDNSTKIRDIIKEQ